MSREPHIADAANSFPGTVPFRGEDAVTPSSRTSPSEPPAIPISRMTQVAKVVYLFIVIPPTRSADSRAFIFRFEHTARKWALLLPLFPFREEMTAIDLESGPPLLRSPGSALALTKNVTQPFALSRDRTWAVFSSRA